VPSLLLPLSPRRRSATRKKRQALRVRKWPWELRPVATCEAIEFRRRYAVAKDALRRFWDAAANKLLREAAILWRPSWGGNLPSRCPRDRQNWRRHARGVGVGAPLFDIKRLNFFSQEGWLRSESRTIKTDQRRPRFPGGWILTANRLMKPGRVRWQTHSSECASRLGSLKPCRANVLVGYDCKQGSRE
jgi:hypothetical protein